MNALYVTHFRAMGCAAHVWLETEADGEAILRSVPAMVEAIEASLSRFRPESELSLVNARAGEWVSVSGLLLEAARKAKHAARLTDGLCNPLILPALKAAGYDRSFELLDTSVASQDAPEIPNWTALRLDLEGSRVQIPEGAGLDLGGIGKGWAAEQIAKLLSEYGSCLVDFGGDIVARGRTWDVMIGEPGHASDNLLAVTLQNRAVATSGTDYRRWQTTQGERHHLIDPRTGAPAISDVVSATVIHTSGYLAEAYAKAILLLGSEAGLDWIGAQWDGAALIVREDRAVLATSNFNLYVKEMVP